MVKMLTVLVSTISNARVFLLKNVSSIRGMFEMNCLFLSGDFKFQVSPKVLISCL